MMNIVFNTTVLLLFLSMNSFAQKSDSLKDEKIRMLLFRSVESDGCNTSEASWDSWIDLLKNHYEFLKIKSTENTSFFKPRSYDTIRTSYQLELHKIVARNSENQSRYALRYKDFYSSVWLRVDGYVENDLNLLFDYLLWRKFKKKDLKEIIKEWESVNPLYKELNLSCKLEGYFKKKTTNSCFISAHYIGINDAIIGHDPLAEKALNSTFSKTPFYGYFRYVRD